MLTVAPACKEDSASTVQGMWTCIVAVQGTMLHFLNEWQIRYQCEP